MDQMIENIINGNLEDAKKQAKRFKVGAIYDAMLFDFGWSKNKAHYGAMWVKGLADWQTFCDAQ
jgi:hypothetical protein